MDASVAGFEGNKDSVSLALDEDATGADVGGSGRQRSTSPATHWARPLGTVPLQRRVGEGSGVSTPVSCRTGNRAFSGGPTPLRSNAALRATYESALLGAVRKQTEALEDKLTNQITRSQQQSDRLREAGLARLEAKISENGGQQPKLDRRLAELTGNYKGLSDELQSQIRRVDTMDARLWEWRHQLEEEFRGKIADFDQHVQKVASSARVTSASHEDAQKRHHQRFRKVEQLMEERVQHAEDTNQGLMSLHARLEAVEVHHDSLEGAAPFNPPTLYTACAKEVDLEGHPELLTIQQRLADLSELGERSLNNIQDVREKVEAQEERLKTLRTLHETKEDQYRHLGEKMERCDWDGRLDQMQQMMVDKERQAAEHHESLELLHKRLEGQVGQHEELRNLHDDLRRGVSDMHAGLPSVMGAFHQIDGEMSGSSPRGINTSALEDTAEVQKRLDDLEAQCDALGTDVQALQSDAELGPRVFELVEQLKHVVPKVIEHDQVVKELADKGASAPDPQHAHDIAEIKLELATLSQGGGWRIKLSADAEERHAQHANEMREEVREIRGWHEERMNAVEKNLEQHQASGKIAWLQDELSSHREELSTQISDHKEEFERALSSLKDKCATNDGHPHHHIVGVQEDLNTLRRELADVCALSKHLEVQANESTLAKDECNDLRRESTRHLDAQEQLRGELANVTNQLGEVRAATDKGCGKEDLDMHRQSIKENHEQMRSELSNLSTRFSDIVDKSDIEAHYTSVDGLVGNIQKSVSELQARIDAGHSATQGVDPEEFKSLVNRIEATETSHGRLESGLREASSAPQGIDAEKFETLIRRLAAAEDSHGRIESGLHDAATRSQGADIEEFQALARRLDEISSLVEAARSAADLDRTGLGDALGQLSKLEEGLKTVINVIQPPEFSGEHGDTDGCNAGLLRRFTELERGVADIRLKATPAGSVREIGGSTGLATQGVGGGVKDSQIAELAKAIRRDEEAEQESHKRLLLRIDELCQRITAVDGAVSTKSGDGSGSNAGVAAQLESLVNRVEVSERGCAELQTKIQGKMEAMNEVLQSISQMMCDSDGADATRNRPTSQDDLSSSVSA